MISEAEFNQFKSSKLGFTTLDYAVRNLEVGSDQIESVKQDIVEELGFDKWVKRIQYAAPTLHEQTIITALKNFLSQIDPYGEELLELLQPYISHPHIIGDERELIMSSVVDGEIDDYNEFQNELLNC